MQSNKTFGLIYQLFLGRQAEANLLDHPHQVFAQLLHYKWHYLTSAGFSAIYLTGLWENQGRIQVTQENGQELITRPHRLPSPFAITDHKAINQLLGTTSDFSRLVGTLHQVNLQVIVDFVPNHTGLDHPWITTHPEYYHYKQDELITEFSGDVAKLNYTNPQLRQEMISILNHIIALGIDGIRVDMAHLIPLEFWQQAIETSKESSCKFIAEAYSESVFDWSIYKKLASVGFDLLYHEFWLRNLKWFAEETIGPEHLVEYLSYFLNNQDANRFLSYIMNHDDTLPVSLHEYIPTLSAMLLFFPGDKLFFNGQLSGLTTRLSHHWAEILSKSYDELTQNFPNFWLQLIQFQRKHQLKLSSLTYVQDKLFQLNFNSNSDITGWINLSSHQINSSELNSKRTEVVWSLQDDNTLGPGGMILVKKV